MNRVFADTSFFVAFVNQRDSWHELAIKAGETLEGPIVTTEFVLVEFGNALCAFRDRHLFVAFVEFMRSAPQFDIVPASSELLERGFTLYAKRPDKDWSLTDCISMAVIQEHRLTDVLTTDHHFEQAGFQILIKR